MRAHGVLKHFANLTRYYIISENNTKLQKLVASTAATCSAVVRSETHISMMQYIPPKKERDNDFNKVFQFISSETTDTHLEPNEKGLSYNAHDCLVCRSPDTDKQHVLTASLPAGSIPLKKSISCNS